MSSSHAPAFAAFGAAHLAALFVIAAFALGLAWLVRKSGAPLVARALRLGLGAGLIATQAAELLSAHAEGRLSREVALPLQLCDLNWLLALAGVLSLDRRVAEPLYFFALAGTLPAVVTPVLPVGFPSARFLVYFATHGLVVITAVVLTFGFGLVPSRGAPWRAFALLNLWALAVTPVNLALGTNFLYLRAKPPSPTPFDWLGPWPFYILGLETGFLAAFLLLDRALGARQRPNHQATFSSRTSSDGAPNR